MNGAAGPLRWMEDPTVRSLFQGFPLPLLLVDAAGSVEASNEAFSRQYAADLGTDDARAAAGTPRASRCRLRLTRRDGVVEEAEARALPVEDRVLLVIHEGPAAAGEVLHLQERLLELERLSATDVLTGAWNRAHLERVIEAEIERAFRLRQPLSLVLVDVDHFKRVNDTHGHPAGDAVLKQLVDLIRARTRAADMVFRWGGEEFVLLATSTSYRAAQKLAEALCHHVQEAVFPSVGGVTISAGVAELELGETADAWFARADAMLYSAKRAGRNQACVDRRGNSDVWAAERRVPLRLEWQDAYECGQPTIDDQHRELFQLANALIATSADPGAAPDGAPAALEALIAHVTRHFADEEALLERHGYVGLPGHRRAHAWLLERAGHLRDELRAGRASLGEIVEFLAGQLVARHLFTADRDFFPLFAGPQGGRPLS